MDEKQESRSYIMWMVFGVLLLLIAYSANEFILTTKKLDVSVDPPTLYPDGQSTATITLIPLNALRFRTPLVYPKFYYTIQEGKGKVTLTLATDSTSLKVQAKYEPGTVSLFLHSNLMPLPIKVTIQIVRQLTDNDEDGFPDTAELTSEEDRMNFRRWFVSITESQLYRLDASWRSEDHDCAGLLRFAYQEALKDHSDSWLRKRAFLVDANIPDIKRFHYPAVPILGEKIFRIRGGAYNPENPHEVDSAFSSFAEARLLKEHSFFLSVDPLNSHAREMSSFI